MRESTLELCKKHEKVFCMEDLREIWDKYIFRCIDYIYGDLNTHNRIKINIGIIKSDEIPEDSYAAAVPVDEETNNLKYTSNIILNFTGILRLIRNNNIGLLETAIEFMQHQVVFALVNIIYKDCDNILENILSNIIEDILSNVSIDRELESKLVTHPSIIFKDPTQVLIDQLKFCKMDKIASDIELMYTKKCNLMLDYDWERISIRHKDNELIKQLIYAVKSGYTPISYYYPNSIFIDDIRANIKLPEELMLEYIG